MTMQPNTTGGNVSETQALAAEIARRTGQVDFWNTAIIVVMVVAFVAAGALVVAQAVAFQRAKQLADAQDQLLKLKDAELKRDLGDKDVKIQEAGERASNADEAAARATERAASLEKEAAASKLETEKLKQVVAWRTISPESAATLGKLLAAKPGAVNLRYTDGDPESLVLAIQFSRILEKAKWQIAPGAEKFANAIQIGIALPDSTGADALTLREAFSAARIDFGTGPLPPKGMSFSVSSIPNAPTLMIGSKRPPLP